MKLIIASILILCCAFAESRKLFLFRPGVEYRFQQTACTIIKLPDLTDLRKSGTCIQFDVRFQAQVTNALIKIENPKVVDYDDRYPAINLYALPMTLNTFEKMYADHLVMPFELLHEDGYVTGIVTGQEPEIVTNLKKALAESFSLPLKSFYQKIQDGLDGAEVFRNMEDDIRGRCRSQYMLQEQPWPGKLRMPVLNITKIRDYEDCIHERTWTRSSHAPYNCTDCDADELSPVNTIKRMDYDSYFNYNKYLIIEKIEVESITTYAPTTTDGHISSVNASKLLILVDRVPIIKKFEVPKPYKKHSLLYTFPRQLPLAEEINNVRARATPFRPNIIQSYPQEARRLIEEIAEDIMNDHRKPIDATPLKVLEASRAIQTLKYEELDALYEEFAGRKANEYADPKQVVKRRVTIQAIAIAGTPPCVDIILSKLFSQKMDDDEGAEIFSYLPVYSFTPTKAIILKFAQVCKSFPITRYVIRESCWLAYGSMVSQACGSNTTNVPTIPGVESYCDEQTEQIYVEEIKKQIAASETIRQRLVYVAVLSLMESPYAIRVLAPIAAGYFVSSRGIQPVHEMVRVSAIYSLEECVDDGDDDYEDEKQVIEIVSPIFYNSSEPLATRAAALKVLMEVAYELHVYEKIAALTWTEDDSQLNGLIISSLNNMANSTNPCDKERAAHAAHAANLVDDNEDDNNDIGIQDSFYYILDDFVEKYDLGSTAELRAIASNNSFIPQKLKLDISTIWSGYKRNQYKLRVKSQGIDSILSRLLGLETAFKHYTLPDIIKPSYENDVSPDYHKLFRKVNIDPLYDDPLMVLTRITTVDYVNKLYYYDYKSLLEFFKNVQQKRYAILRDGLSINYQKITHTGIVQHQMPSTLGISIFVEFKKPSITNWKGIIKVEYEKEGNPENLEFLTLKKIVLKSDLHVTTSTSTSTTISTVNPFTKQEPGMAVSTNHYVSIPLKIDVKVDFTETKLQYVINPLQNFSQVQEPVILFRHKVKPYSFNRPYTTFQWIPTMAREIVIKPKEYKYDLSKYLGIPSEFVIKSDRFWQDRSSMWSHILERNLITHFFTGLIPTNFKLVEYTLKVDPRAAYATKIAGFIDLDYTGSEIQNYFLEGKRTLRDYAGFLLGFTSMPWSCQKSDEMPSSAYSRSFSEEDDFSSSKFSPDYDSISHGFGGRFDLDTRTKREAYMVPIFWGPLPKYSKVNQTVGDLKITQIPYNNETTTTRIVLKTLMDVKGARREQSLKSTFTWARSKASLEDNIAFEVIADKLFISPAETIKATISGKFKYGKLACGYKYALDPTKVPPTVAEFGILLGKNQETPKRIRVDAIFSKSKDDIEYQTSKDNWLIQQCKEDQEQGNVLSDVCQEAMQSVASYGKMTLSIKYPNDLSLRFFNTSYKIDNFLKYYFYEQMRIIPVESQNNQLNVRVGYIADGPGINITMKKPYEVVTFNDTYIPVVYDFIYPLNAHDSYWKMFVEDVTAKTTPVTCKVMDGYVETFDNDTYPYTMSNCYHIVTKDCSPSDVFSVLLKRYNEKRKILKVHLLEHTIKVIPIEKDKYAVSVDGYNLTVEHDTIYFVMKKAQNMEKVLLEFGVVGKKLHIKSDALFLNIWFNGYTVKTLVSNLYRGGLCGMCSNFDGDRGSTLIGPDQCEYASPKDLCFSYAVKDENCRFQAPSNKKICPEGSKTRGEFSGPRANIKIDYGLGGFEFWGPGGRDHRDEPKSIQDGDFTGGFSKYYPQRPRTSKYDEEQSDYFTTPTSPYYQGPREDMKDRSSYQYPQTPDFTSRQYSQNEYGGRQRDFSSSYRDKSRPYSDPSSEYY